MPLDGTADDIEADFEVLEAVGRRHEDAANAVMTGGGPLRTLRKWLHGHAEAPDDADARASLLAMAVDLELFTPSPSGSTPMSRYLRAARGEDAMDAQALEALSGARWRLVRIETREGPDEVLLTDLVGGERLRLLDSYISPLAGGCAAVLRLCPLGSGRHILISPLFTLDEAALSVVWRFVRPGRGLDAHRCAAVVYRDMARRGFAPMPELDAVPDLEDLIAELSEVEHLALRWLQGGNPEPDADLLADIRRAASTTNIVDACGCFGQPRAVERGLAGPFEGVARLQVETLAERMRARGGDFAHALAQARDQISGFVASGTMHASARDLFERLAARWAHAGPASEASGAGNESELARVLKLVQSLRQRTVERGCTEAEAMAAAAKLADLLARHDLTLDEIQVRGSRCEAAAVSTGRRRRAPIDSCMASIAAFCDCRAWEELGDAGDLRHVFFGLRADVEGARLLNDLVGAAFDSETAVFRRTRTWLALTGGDRRMAANSFQVGLASGIGGRLDALRRARTDGVPRTSGFDLVAAKHSVIDEELERLGLAFATRPGRRRRVHGEAYAAGRAAGEAFEPRPGLAA
jgi:hypothetical protein